MWRLSKHAALFAVGAIAYFEIELHWRYFAGTLPVHWTMPILGGVLFLLLGGLNEWLPWEMPFWGQCLLGAAMVTAAEFAAGCVLNLWLGLGVWDYTDMPFNLMGQICLPFSAAWIVVSAAAILLDDWLRWQLYGEDKPHYRWIYGQLTKSFRGFSAPPRPGRRAFCFAKKRKESPWM